MWKKHKVVMLPTNEKANIGSIVIRPSDNRMAIVNVLTVDDTQPCIHSHLYILSDDEINKNDWFYCPRDKYVSNSNLKRNLLCKKIIVTTDSSLWEHDDTVSYPKTRLTLPQPSQQFIKIFIEEYNKGNIITEVMVEYGIYYKDGYNNWLLYNKEFWDKTGNKPKFGTKEQLKINPDNTINIKPIKDNWNKKEVSNLLIKAMGDAVKNDRIPNHISIAEFSINWIDKNL